MRRWLASWTRQQFGVRNRAPWLSIFGHTFHQFHENDLFTPAAAMSYFGLLTLFPALLVLLALGNNFDLGKEMLNRAVDVYPGSREFLATTIRSLENVGPTVILTCIVVTVWAGLLGLQRRRARDQSVMGHEAAHVPARAWTHARVDRRHRRAADRVGALDLRARRAPRDVFPLDAAPA